MGRIFPLNSRRITAQILKRIVEQLEVAATGSLDEIRAAVDGKLAELGQEPRNVQVLIGEESASLADAEGVFLTVEWESETVPTEKDDMT